MLSQHSVADDRRFRTFSLSPTFIEKFKSEQPKWGWGGLGYFTYKRTYARDLADGRTEEWWQTVQRVVEGCFNIQKQHCRQMGLPWKEDKAQGSAQDMFQRMWDFKFTPPGRGLWMMGTEALMERGSAALQNCAFVSTENLGEDFAAPFVFLMDMSMLGVGVGGDTRGVSKARLHMPRITEEVYVVEDSREGWVDLIRTVLNSFALRGHFPLVIDYSKVRRRGTPIKTFGGIASGPKPLHGLVENLVKLLLPKGTEFTTVIEAEDDMASIQKATFTFTEARDLLGETKSEAYRISSGQIVDIFNFIGKAVVAGGVRRTAEIMFGEPDDAEFLGLKQDMAALNDRRWASNNSVFGYVGMDYAQASKAMSVNGEPGIFWIENARKFGRMGHPADNRDWRVMGTNPCVTGDTITMTAQGPRRADRSLKQPFTAVVSGDFGESVTGDRHACTTGFFKTGEKPVYLLKTKEGHTLKLTRDHLVRAALKTTRYKRHEADVEAGELSPGDQIVLNDNRGVEAWVGPGTQGLGWALGSLIGEGHFHTDGYATLQFWGDSKRVMLEIARDVIASLGGDDRYHDQRTGTEVPARDMVSVKSVQLLRAAAEYGIGTDKSVNNDLLLLASSEFQKGFLRGLFDADGTVGGSQEHGLSVRLPSVTMQHLHYAQCMLLNLGINSTIYENRRDAGDRLMPDGKGGMAMYPCKALHELVISNSNLYEFASRVGFNEPEKKQALSDGLSEYKRGLNRERFVATFESLTFLGVESVYDCTVEGAHHFSANGIVVHNCAEQPLESFELCNLVETYPAHHDTYEDFEKTLKMAYLYAKTVTLLPTHDPRANAVMMRNRRIGCSMSGIVQSMSKFGRRGFLKWCDNGYDYVQKLDRTYSEWLGIPLSVKTTTVKPSGTVSLLCGATPGIHYPHSEYYIRRVRVQGTSPLIQACKDAGYHVEPDVYADDTMVVSFPVHEEFYIKGKTEATMWEQFANAAAMQHHWADNQVSVTVTFNKAEGSDLQACLEMFEDKLKSISVLPLDDHNYQQAPYETITKEVYDRMMEPVKPIVFAEAAHEVTEAYCSNDKCEVPVRAKRAAP